MFLQNGAEDGANWGRGLKVDEIAQDTLIHNCVGCFNFYFGNCPRMRDM